MPKVADALAPAGEDLNESTNALRQFRAKLDSVSPELPAALYDSLSGMSDEATNVLKRMFKMQEKMRDAAKTPDPGATVVNAK